LDHEFSEVQSLLGQTAKEFFSRDYPLDRMREILRSPDGYDSSIWGNIIELGWTAAPFPEAIGGTGGGFADSILLIEEMGKACASSPYIHSVIASGLALIEADPQLAAAVTAGSAAVVPVLTLDGDASVSGDRATVSGSAAAVPWAEVATHYLVASLDPDAMIVVEGRDLPARRQATTGGEPLYEVSFDGASGRVVRRDGLRDDVEALGAAGNAIYMLGLCQTTLELASDYAKQRIQFGKPIGAFQAISHKCANMVVDIEVGRYLTYKPAWQHANGLPFRANARYAKSWMGDATARVTRDGIQVHGGVGFIDDHFVQLPYRLGLGAASQYGTAREHRRAVADAILGPAG
jgi:alkylation response protein AidB-like acyl-CoA dehydrogenase